MPRRARLVSDSNIYHVMLRGVDRRLLFEEDADRFHFLSCLEAVRDHSGLTLYAYCLMDNHVHLLVEAGSEALGTTMKRLGVRYARYFNQKYGRLGPLFQDRFRSEPVGDDRYFIAALRYIWRNPVEAGICERGADYEWGSRYWLDSPYSLVKRSDLIRRTGVTDLASLEQDDATGLPERLPLWRVHQPSDTKAVALVRDLTGITSTSEFHLLSRDTQRDCVRELHAQGLSVRQLARVTGVTKATVEWWTRREPEAS